VVIAIGNDLPDVTQGEWEGVGMAEVVAPPVATVDGRAGAGSSSSGSRLRLPVAGTIVGSALAAIYTGVSWFFSGKLIARQFPADYDEVVFAEFGLPQPENVTFANGATRLAGWYFANPRRAGCAVILLHGFTGNRATVLDAAPLFWDRGCDLLLYDLRGHGQSSGGFVTYGVHDKGDTLAAVDWLSQRTGLSDGRIGLMGWSWGAATALQTAAVRPELAFVFADASYSSLPAIARVQAKALFGAWATLFVPGALFISGLRADFDPKAAAPEDAVRGLTTPVLLVHSTTDEFTPYEHSEAIFANSDPRHTRLELTRWGAAHAKSYTTDPVAYTRLVDEFLATFVPNFGSRLT
jgi:pimeloyl-ACP methyl ester carboxylesterase